MTMRQDPPLSVPVRCQCETRLEIPLATLGKRLNCPQCGRSLRLVAHRDTRWGALVWGILIYRSGPGRVGEQFLLWGESAIEIGKLPERDLQISGGNVSRMHCRLVPQDGRCVIEDCKSTNGLFVNGARIAHRVLEPGDRIRVGEVELEFAATDSATLAPSKHRDCANPHGPAKPKSVPKPIHSRRNASQSDDSDEEGVYRIAEDFERPQGIADVDEGRAPNVHADGDSLEGGLGPWGVERQGESVECPNCKQWLPSSAVICVPCGINIKTGRPILTSQDTNLDGIYMTAERIIWWCSWPFPVGIYPIASEALGTKRPHVIRAIALVTVVISVWFLCLEWTDSPRAASWMGLMLWSANVEEDAESSLSDPMRFDAESEDQPLDDGTADELDGDANVALEREDAEEEHWSERLKFGRHKPAQYVTHAFLHGDLLHLAGNLVFLLVFGSRVNALLGGLSTLLLYPLLATAAAWAWVVSMQGEPAAPMIGASGAIMGLAGVYFVMFPRHKIHMAAWLGFLFPIYLFLILGYLFGLRLLIFPIFIMLVIAIMRWASEREFALPLRIWPLGGYWVVLSYIAFDVFYTVLRVDDGVAHWAHLGGFLAGTAIALILLFSRLVNARGADLVSTLLGKRAWGLVGPPRQALGPMQRLP